MSVLDKPFILSELVLSLCITYQDEFWGFSINFGTYRDKSENLVYIVKKPVVKSIKHMQIIPINTESVILEFVLLF